MPRSINNEFLRLLTMTLCAVLICALATPVFSQNSPAQNSATQNNPPASAPVAFVYVSSSPSENNYQINAFSAAANGQLTPVPGSPFPAQVKQLAVNGKYLFGTDGTYIYTFSIASNGALAQVSSINAQQLNGGSGGPIALFLDHTGATLYDFDYAGDDGNNDYQSFSVNQSTGALTYLGATSQSSEYFESLLSFIGNNQYAYSSSCYHFNPDIYGFQRESNQTLNELNITPTIPDGPTGSFYCPYLATADPNNNVAIAMVPLNDTSWQPTGPYQLAVYTADASGNLTTSSTSANMPSTAVQTVTDYWMSPSGQLLAVAGTGGAQVFHFNGSNPITPYTGLLTKFEVDQVFWDNSNHLYGLATKSNQLFAGTVTPTSLSKVPGSPYQIANPIYLSVLPEK
jgi:hypothetical protein